MAATKLSFDDFIQGMNVEDLDYAKNLHDYMLNNGCKATFEEKKTSLLCSYKHAKTKKSVINVLVKKNGLFVRIYGENIGEYRDFLNTLPTEMVQSIEKSGTCARLANGGCSPKCSGYDFMIGDAHFQKCRYNCFEFLVNSDSNSHIRTFVENELTARNSAV